jgi:hypothetical protein
VLSVDYLSASGNDNYSIRHFSAENLKLFEILRTLIIKKEINRAHQMHKSSPKGMGKKMIKKLANYELANEKMSKVMGGSHCICIGTWIKPSGETFMDIVRTSGDGDWIDEPMCDEPDSKWGGLVELGDDVCSPYSGEKVKEGSSALLSSVKTQSTVIAKLF